MGGTKEPCNTLAREIWMWCYNNDNWITGSYLPGAKSTDADKESRSIHDNMEWTLNQSLFDKIVGNFGTPEVDLFASRLNHKLPSYFAWKPDPGAAAIDAFHENWSNIYFYAFPPFNLISRVLKKVVHDKAEGLIIVPFWPTQAWFSKLIKLLNGTPFILFSRKEPTVTHTWREESSLPKTRLMIAPISARNTLQWQWHPQLNDSSVPPGAPGPKHSTMCISDSSISFVYNGVKFTPPYL
ncbi:MAG: hypothetical protein GY705_23610 [Bacteroidetes bacterium]|nr:hypothetical protein [Bacteroidota bacterium]